MSRRPPNQAAWQSALRLFPRRARPALEALWDNGGRLPADSVARICAELRVTPRALMVRLLPLAQAYAAAPVSHYPVGAVAAGAMVRGAGAPALYFGANLEIPGVALSFTVHAEQSAVNHAWLHGEPDLTALAVSAAPCGYCRQFLQELPQAGALPLILPAANRAGCTVRPLRRYLPQAFGPTDLGIRGGLMDPALSAPSLRLAAAARDPLVAAARDAAQRSYAPYPTDRAGQFSGVALQLEDGRHFTGRYAGNAAYNPSLSPLESALAFLRLSVPPGAKVRIIRCVLVEVPTLASQRSATAAVLDACAPGVGLEYHAARSVALPGT